MSDSHLLRGFIEYQRLQNSQRLRNQEQESRAGLLYHMRRHVKSDSIAEFGERVGIEALRILLTEICADPRTFQALSRDEYLHIAEVCEFNISNWVEQLPR